MSGSEGGLSVDGHALESWWLFCEGRIPAPQWPSHVSHIPRGHTRQKRHSNFICVTSVRQRCMARRVRVPTQQKRVGWGQGGAEAAGLGARIARGCSLGA